MSTVEQPTEKYEVVRQNLSKYVDAVFPSKGKLEIASQKQKYKKGTSSTAHSLSLHGSKTLSKANWTTFVNYEDNDGEKIVLGAMSLGVKENYEEGFIMGPYGEEYDWAAHILLKWMYTLSKDTKVTFLRFATVKKKKRTSIRPKPLTVFPFFRSGTTGIQWFNAEMTLFRLASKMDIPMDDRKTFKEMESAEKDRISNKTKDKLDTALNYMIQLIMSRPNVADEITLTDWVVQLKRHLPNAKLLSEFVLTASEIKNVSPTDYKDAVTIVLKYLVNESDNAFLHTTEESRVLYASYLKKYVKYEIDDDNIKESNNPQADQILQKVNEFEESDLQEIYADISVSDASPLGRLAAEQMKPLPASESQDSDLTVALVVEKESIAKIVMDEVYGEDGDETMDYSSWQFAVSAPPKITDRYNVEISHQYAGTIPLKRSFLKSIMTSGRIEENIMSKGWLRPLWFVYSDLESEQTDLTPAHFNKSPFEDKEIMGRMYAYYEHLPFRAFLFAVRNGNWDESQELYDLMSSNEYSSNLKSRKARAINNEILNILRNEKEEDDDEEIWVHVIRDIVLMNCLIGLWDKTFLFGNTSSTKVQPYERTNLLQSLQELPFDIVKKIGTYKPGYKTAIILIKYGASQDMREITKDQRFIERVNKTYSVSFDGDTMSLSTENLELSMQTSFDIASYALFVYSMSLFEWTNPEKFSGFPTNKITNYEVHRDNLKLFVSDSIDVFTSIVRVIQKNDTDKALINMLKNNITEWFSRDMYSLALTINSQLNKLENFDFDDDDPVSFRLGEIKKEILETVKYFYTQPTNLGLTSVTPWHPDSGRRILQYANNPTVSKYRKYPNFLKPTFHKDKQSFTSMFVKYSLHLSCDYIMFHAYTIAPAAWAKIIRQQSGDADDAVQEDDINLQIMDRLYDNVANSVNSMVSSHSSRNFAFINEMNIIKQHQESLDVETAKFLNHEKIEFVTQTLAELSEKERQTKGLDLCRMMIPDVLRAIPLVHLSMFLGIMTKDTTIEQRREPLDEIVIPAFDAMDVDTDDVSEETKLVDYQQLMSYMEKASGIFVKSSKNAVQIAQYAMGLLELPYTQSESLSMQIQEMTLSQLSVYIAFVYAFNNYTKEGQKERIKGLMATSKQRYRRSFLKSISGAKPSGEFGEEKVNGIKAPERLFNQISLLRRSTGVGLQVTLEGLKSEVEEKGEKSGEKATKKKMEKSEEEEGEEDEDEDEDSEFIAEDDEDDDDFEIDTEDEDAVVTRTDADISSKVYNAATEGFFNDTIRAKQLCINYPIENQVTVLHTKIEEGMDDSMPIEEEEEELSLNSVFEIYQIPPIFLDQMREFTNHDSLATTYPFYEKLDMQKIMELNRKSQRMFRTAREENRILKDFDNIFTGGYNLSAYSMIYFQLHVVVAIATSEYENSISELDAFIVTNVLNNQSAFQLRTTENKQNLKNEVAFLIFKGFDTEDVYKKQPAAFLFNVYTEIFSKVNQGIVYDFTTLMLETIGLRDDINIDKFEFLQGRAKFKLNKLMDRIYPQFESSGLLYEKTNATVLQIRQILFRLISGIALQIYVSMIYMQGNEEDMEEFESIIAVRGVHDEDKLVDASMIINILTSPDWSRSDPEQRVEYLKNLLFKIKDRYAHILTLSSQ